MSTSWLPLEVVSIRLVRLWGPLPAGWTGEAAAEAGQRTLSFRVRYLAGGWAVGLGMWWLIEQTQDTDVPALAISGLALEGNGPPSTRRAFDMAPFPTGLARGPLLSSPGVPTPALELTSALLGALGD